MKNLACLLAVLALAVGVLPAPTPPPDGGDDGGCTIPRMHYAVPPSPVGPCADPAAPNAIRFRQTPTSIEPGSCDHVWIEQRFENFSGPDTFDWMAWDIHYDQTLLWWCGSESGPNNPIYIQPAPFGDSGIHWESPDPIPGAPFGTDPATWEVYMRFKFCTIPGVTIPPAGTSVGFYFGSVTGHQTPHGIFASAPGQPSHLVDINCGNSVIVH